ncbi:MAG: HAMP domain-containing histidine kinase [Ruminococcaceae bacterium]|nr:HAMP domain-containing histidine kinase [Oscillospiraceae bacterium]
MLKLLEGLYKAARDPVIIMKGSETVHRNNAAMQLGDFSLPDEFCCQPVPFVGALVVDKTEYQLMASAAGEYRVFVLYVAEKGNMTMLASLGASIKDSVTTIQMASNALKKNDTDTKAQYYRSVMNHQLHTINRLAGNMLYLGEGGKRSDNESVNIVELYGDLIDSVNVFIKDKKAKVYFSPAVSDLMVYGDSMLLERLLLNLLSNSLKATPADGKIVVTIERKDKRAMITVQDTGKGISESILANLFGSFNVERSLSESYQSIGMGLSIVREIAGSMGGTVIAKSEEGKGTMVTVSLPVSEKNVFCSPSVRYGAKSMRLLQTELCEVLTADCYGDLFND